MTFRTLAALLFRTRLIAAWITISLSLFVPAATSATTTSVPISAGLATGIAADLFPVTVKLDKGNLFLTDPAVLYLENGRVGMRVRFQAFDHRPEEGIAISETGQAMISGILGYDVDTRRVLLHDPKIEELVFDQKNTAAQSFLSQMHAAWSAHVTNPLRAELPPHPYLIPFRNNIQNLDYDGERIVLSLSYD